MTSPFPLTAGAVAEACHGRLIAGDAVQPLSTFSADTRTLQPGDAFIALSGPHFDGNAFVAEAARRGARAAIVSDDRGADASRGAGLITIRVNDTLAALQSLAHEVRRLSGVRVVAITGSAGKTTTKEAAATLLAGKFRTFRNRGNLNNHIGLPLSLLELQKGAEVAVVELGMNHAGEISTLVAIAEPEVRVWTNVGTAHLGHFGTVEAIADAKAEILERATAETVLVANADDPHVMARVPSFPGRTVTFGIEATADVRAVSVRSRGVDGQDADVQTPAGDVRLSLRLPGKGHLANVLAAVAVAWVFGVPLADVAERAASLAPASHRGEILELRRGIRVFDDSYNSSPDALVRALEVIGETPTAGRKIAVLGEMLELGEQSEALHRRCGREVVGAGVEYLVTVGGAPARALGEAAHDSGLDADAVRHFEESDTAAAHVIAVIADGDLVMVKGSRGVRLERVVDRLRVDFV